MRNAIWLVVAAGLMVLVTTVPATAATDLTMGDWQRFGWDGRDGARAGTFTFTSDSAAVVTITDAFCPGDRMTLTDHRHDLGVTTVPEKSTCKYLDSSSHPGKALLDPAYSHGRFVVGAGDHAIQVVASTSPFRGGAAFIRVDAMTTAMCKGGGWTGFGGEVARFRNQGECVATVMTGG